MSKDANSLVTAPKISIKFLFSHSADLISTRRFYSELIGLEERQFELELGYLCYQCDGFELMFFKNKQPTPQIPTEWASQPGYEGGKLETSSWAIGVPEAEFAEVVKKLKGGGVRLFQQLPEWRQGGYWGFTAMDPNGVTVEVYTIPKEKPALVEWIDT